MKKTSHLAWLDSVRAIAALWVVLHHAFLTVRFTPSGLAQTVLYRFLGAGHYSVTLFIAISGYALAYQAGRSGWTLRDGYREFVTARFIRIVPPYYASIALSLLLIATLIGKPMGTHWDVSTNLTLGGIVKHLLLIQNISGAGQINHVYWSIGVEFQIYLFFGLILYGIRRGGPVGAMVVAAMLSFAARAFYSIIARTTPVGFWTMQTSLVPYFLVFGAGVVACWATLNRPEPGRRYGWALGALAVGGIVFDVLRHEGLHLPAIYEWDDELIGCTFALLLYVLSTHEALGRAFSLRPLAALGTFVYSIYLTHAPLLQVVYVLVGRWHPQETFARSLLFVVVASAFSIAFAYGFFLAVERPCFKLRHALMKAKARRASA